MEYDIKTEPSDLHNEIDNIENIDENQEKLSSSTSVNELSISGTPNILNAEIKQEKSDLDNQLDIEEVNEHDNIALNSVTEILPDIEPTTNITNLIPELTYPKPDQQEKCLICNFMFSNKIALKNHIKTEHSVEPANKTCELCYNNEQYTEKEFEQHLIDQHFGRIANNLRRVTYPSYCKCSEILKDYDSAVNHMCVSHDMFKEQYEKAVKQRKESKMRVQMFECEVCKKNGLSQMLRFSKIGALRFHVATKHFKNLILTDLKSTIEKYPKCPWPKCSAMYTNLKLLKDHFALYHKDEDFDTQAQLMINKCPEVLCNQGPFNTFDNLLLHLSYNHPQMVDKYLQRLDLETTLTPLPAHSIPVSEEPMRTDLRKTTFKPTSQFRTAFKPASQFTKEEKEAIVKEVVENYISPHLIAKKHNVYVSVIRNWVKNSGKTVPIESFKIVKKNEK